MALVACRECGKMVSTEAAACPDCGVPNPTQKPWAATATKQPVSGASFAQPGRMTSQENSVYQAHLHWVVYLQAAGVALLGAGLLVATQLAQIPPYAGVGVLAVAAVLGVMAYIQSKSTEFVITTRRLIAKRGIVSRRTIETLIEKVEAVTVEQGLLGRILGYGKVTVTGTGGTNETFSLVSDPLQLRKVIHEQIDRARS